MADQTQKLAFAQHVQNLANELASFQDRWTDAFNVQTAREWDPGGDDPITDEDIAGANITAAQLNSFLSTLRTRFVSLMSGQTVSGVVAGRSVTDTIRSDL
jgi:hypothetical protein